MQTSSEIGSCHAGQFRPRRQAPIQPPPGTTSPFDAKPPPKGKTPPKVPKAPTAPGDAQTRVNHAFAPEFRNLLNQIPADRRAGVGLKTLIEHSPGVDYRTIMTKLGTTTKTCLRHHVIGSRGMTRCTKEHAPLTIPPGGAAAACTGLQPGCAACIASSV